MMLVERVSNVSLMAAANRGETAGLLMTVTEELRRRAAVRGWEVEQTMVVNAPPRDVLDISKLVAARCVKLPPSIGWDANGSVTEEYPTQTSDL